MRWNRRDMASMNNSFAYIRYHIGRDRNFLILYGIVLVCLFPLLALGLQNNLKTRECLMILLFLLMAVMCVMALVLPVYLFHFLWNRREMDLYASVGMKRKTFYAYKYGIGVAYLWLPPFVVLLLTMLLLRSGGMDLAVLEMMGKIFALGLLLYSLNVWIAIVCRSRLDAILMVVSYFVLPLLLILALQTLLVRHASLLVYCQPYDLLYEGVLTNPIIRWIASIISVPSAGILLVVEVPVQLMVEGIGNNVHLLPSGVWLVWLALSVVLFFGARRSFITKKAEDAQTPTTSLFLYPCVICALTLALLLLSGGWDASFGWYVYDFFNPPFIAAVFLYFILWFIAQRQVHVRARHVTILLALIASVFLLEQGFLTSNGFGLISERIDADAEKVQVEITMGMLYGDSYHSVTTTMFSREDNESAVDELLELQDVVIEDAKAQAQEAVDIDNDQAMYYDITFRFKQSDALQTRSYVLYGAAEDELYQKYDEILQSLRAKGMLRQEYVQGATDSSLAFEAG